MSKNLSRAFMGGFGPIFATNDTGESTSGGGDGAGGDPKTFTQEDVDRIVQERLARAKPAKPADYDDLKAKAKAFDDVQKSNLSAEQQLQQAQDAAAQANARTARLQAAIDHKVPADLVDLLGENTDATAIEARAKLLGELDAARTELATIKAAATDKGTPPPPPATNRGGASPRDRDTLANGAAGLAEAQRRFQKTPERSQ